MNDRLDDSEFTADVLLPKSGRHEWLVRRRPRVEQLLSEAGFEATDDNMIGLLLKLLHDSESLQGAWEATYEMVNTTIIQMPELIWSMLVRAESWFVARDEIRKKWGGTRENAGRSKRSSNS